MDEKINQIKPISREIQKGRSNTAKYVSLTSEKSGHAYIMGAP